MEAGEVGYCLGQKGQEEGFNGAGLEQGKRKESKKSRLRGSGFELGRRLKVMTAISRGARGGRKGQGSV